MSRRVDYEQAWLALREFLVTDDDGRPRQGIGIDKLLARMGHIEAECGFDEGLLEGTLRRYGVVISDDIRLSGVQPAPPERSGADGDGQRPAHSGGGLEAAPKEEAPEWPPSHHPAPATTRSLQRA